MFNDFTNKAVLVTGGTQGIGLATGLAFGRVGARVYATHRWGSADEGDIGRQFAEAGAPEPRIVEADVSHDGDAQRVFEQIKAECGKLDVFVSNACVVSIVRGLEGLSRRDLFRSLEYSAWPLVAYLQRAKAVFGQYPRYVVGTSSDGPDHYYEGYEYVALAKQAMEVFCRYLAKDLADEGVRINMVRTRNVVTASALEMHGADYPDFVKRYGGEGHFVAPEEVAEAILALCSGLMDAMSGQVVTVDKGGAFADNLMRLYHGRREYGL